MVNYTLPLKGLHLELTYFCFHVLAAASYMAIPNFLGARKDNTFIHQKKESQIYQHASLMTTTGTLLIG